MIEQYRHLIGLTQLYLLEQYGLKSTLIAELAHYQFLKELARQEKKFRDKDKEGTAKLHSGSKFALLASDSSVSQIVQAGSPYNQQDMSIGDKTNQGKKNQLLNSEASFVTLSEGDKMKKNEGPSTLHHEFKTLMKENFPQQKILQEPLHPLEAKLTKIVMLSFEQQEERCTFLNNVVAAITKHLGPAVLLTPQNWTEHEYAILLNSLKVKWIIASEADIQRTSMLKQQYSTKNGQTYLKDTPLFLLQDVSIYLQDQQKKKFLWDDMKQRLKL